MDGTLAEYHGWQGSDHIGAPIPAMVERVKAWLADGKDVRIFTARGADPDSLLTIYNWCRDHLGQVLKVTNQKDMGMIALWDDRCRQVETNTGRLIGAEEE